MDCETPDFIFPMYADLYYPIISQGGYGEIKKEWVFDRTIVCNATAVGGAGEEEIKPAEFLQYENKLITRTKTDIRKSSNEINQAITNILITNIRLSSGEIVYQETSGPRNGRGTIYEIATVEPFVGPFQNVEYFKVLLRRTENQTVSDLWE